MRREPRTLWHETLITDGLGCMVHATDAKVTLGELDSRAGVFEGLLDLVGLGLLDA